MATYKVLQDIEAEDKLIGPFGIRQFIYLLIVAATLFIGFRLALVSWFLVIPLIPHTIFFAMLALPVGGEQPTEAWLLAKIRFAVKPRTRIWSQSGVMNLVTITVPKTIEHRLTKDLSQYEVQSRLSALANTIDSRGWAVKNVDVNLFSQPAFSTGTASSDRLISYDNAVTEVPTFNITASDDILDERNNPTAQNLDRLINASSKDRRDKLVSSMQHHASQTPQPEPPHTNWFQPPTKQTPTSGSTIVTPDPVAVQQSKGLALKPLSTTTTSPLTEEELLEKIHAEQAYKPKNNLHVVKTLEQQAAEAKQTPAPDPAQNSAPTGSNTTVTAPVDPDILELANNDDLNVETIARQANKKKANDNDAPGDEVVINLH